MSFWDSFGNSGTDFWSSFGDSGSTDWTSGSGLDWTSMFSGDGSDFGGGSDSSGGSWISKLFGGGGSSGSSGSNIFGSILSGLGGAASAELSAKDAKELLKLKGSQDLAAIAAQGLQGRKSLDFEGQLKDYYTQQDKSRKRVALDTYGQFSLMNKIKPNYKNTSPGVSVPPKPVVS